MDWHLLNATSVSTQKTIGKEGRGDRGHRAPAGVPPKSTVGSREPSVRPGDWAGQGDEGAGGGEGRRGSLAGERQPSGPRQGSPDGKHVVSMLFLFLWGRGKGICKWLRFVLSSYCERLNTGYCLLTSFLFRLFFYINVILKLLWFSLADRAGHEDRASPAPARGTAEEGGCHSSDGGEHNEAGGQAWVST